MANRPFSKRNSTLKFFIKKVSVGRFTEWLFNQNQFNEKFEISGKEGSFFIRQSDKNLIFIAGGSGLSAIFSILENTIFNQDVEINKKS